MTETIINHVATALLRPMLTGESGLPQVVKENLPAGRVSEIEECAKGIRGEAVAPAGRSCQEQADAWMDNQYLDVRTGEMTPRRWTCVKSHLERFLSFVGSKADVKTITDSKLDAFEQHLKKQVGAQVSGGEGISSKYANEVFATSRRWVRKWVYGTQKLIPLPENISKRVSFGHSAKPIITWRVDEVHMVLGEASERMRLFLLLMLNCGFTQKDISDLQDGEVDWTTGRITRKRSKTKRKKNTPLV
jgi:hypothetical protein